MSNDRPNLVAGDPEGNPDPDTDHLVSGRVPGAGGDGYWTVSDGELEPADSERPLNVEQVHTESRGPSVVVHTKDDGTIVADGPDSELASGDSSVEDDVSTVLQAALDEGGHITVKKHDQPYTMAVGGQDPEGSDYCLAATSYTTLEIEAGATLEYPADSTTSPPDVATPIWLPNDLSSFKITGEGTIDAGYHREDQTDESTNAMGIKIGCRDIANSISDIVIEDITATGAWRHFIEAIGAEGEGPERGLIRGVTFDDGSGDDDVSISTGARHWTVRDCWSINKVREGRWTAACYEAEDGGRHVVFDSLYAIDPDCTGITMGKSHGPDPGCRNHTAVNCTIITPSGNGFNVTPTGHSSYEKVTESIHFLNCEVINPTKQGVHLGGGDSNSVQQVVRDVTLDVRMKDVTNHGVNITMTNAVLEGLKIPDTAVIRNAGEYSVRFAAPSTDIVYKDFDIDGATLTSQKTPIQMGGTAADNYDGLSHIRNCRFESGGSAWPDHRAGDDDNVYQHVLATNNNSDEDPAPVAPANPDASMWYIDDGTNTGSGTMGKRVYDGSAWVDVWTV